MEVHPQCGRIRREEAMVVGRKGSHRILPTMAGDSAGTSRTATSGNCACGSRRLGRAREPLVGPEPLARFGIIPLFLVTLPNAYSKFTYIQKPYQGVEIYFKHADLSSRVLELATAAMRFRSHPWA